MPAIVEFPQVVRRALDEFGDLFSCEPQRRHFAEYLTGLMVAANKTVTGINGEFVDTTDQSCLNRFITAVEWDEQAINERRLELMQRDPTTRYSDQGVIALDDTLIDHDGKFIKDVGWFWDHAKEPQDYPRPAACVCYHEGHDRFCRFREATLEMRFCRGEGLAERVFASGKPAWSTDMQRDFIARRGRCRGVGHSHGSGLPRAGGRKGCGRPGVLLR